MEDRFEKLNELLQKENNWPKTYMFKFIFPANNQLLAQVEALFSEESEIKIKESAKGNYLSVTVEELMLNPEQVLDKYTSAAKINGVMFF